jgi:hypothetical protein
VRERERERERERVLDEHIHDLKELLQHEKTTDKATMMMMIRIPRRRVILTLITF